MSTSLIKNKKVRCKVKWAIVKFKEVFMKKIMMMMLKKQKILIWLMIN